MIKQTVRTMVLFSASNSIDIMIVVDKTGEIQRLTRIENPEIVQSVRDT